MESIKHKMDLMIQEKNAAVEKAIGFEAETAGLETSAKKFEKEVDEIQRKIAKVEDELDITISKVRGFKLIIWIETFNPYKTFQGKLFLVFFQLKSTMDPK